MATYKICKKCNEFVEYKQVVKHEFGNDIIEYKCPKCGYIDKTTVSRVHYGNDAIKK